MSLSDIYVHLNQLGYKIEVLGDISTLKVNDYYIENRCIDSGFRVIGNNVFLSVYYGEDVVRFFKQRLLK
ncbi:hypothetical protein qdsa001_2 [Staphylococcus phage qdsa001]|nr:hypothetical protein qdsa001_2 [Staphylococcus phage qdsa001]QXV86214.1 hypothetical protein [Staphylococcus phage SAPYZU_15]